MRQSTNPGDGTLDTQPETRMWDGSKTPQIEIPGVTFPRDSNLGHALFDQVWIVDALAAACDFAVTFRGQQVNAAAHLRATFDWLHVKRFHRRGIVIHENRLLELLCERRFVWRPEIVAPIDV